MQKLRRIGSATIAVKLAGVLISLSLVVFLLGAFLVHEQNRALSFSRKEVHGVRLHRSIRPLWLWIAYQEPDAQGLRDALAKVEGSSGSGAERVLVPAAAERVRLTGEEMARIVEAEGRLPAKNLEELKAATFAYIRAVGDASNLILDPDLDSYYAMDLTTVTLPRLRGNLHQAYRHTRQADHGGHGLDFERTIHQESLDLARFSVQSSVRNLRFRNDGVMELNLKALERAGDRFFQAAEQQGDSPATRAAYREAIEAAENLWGSAATVLSQVLADRISGMNFRRQVTLSVSAVLALFAIGLSAALMRGITARTRLLSARLDELETEDVKALHDGIVALSRGDWDRALEIRERRPLDPGDMDELGRMAEAANRLTNQTMRATLALKHTQSALRLAEEEVSLSNQRFRDTVEALDEGVILLNAFGHVQFANRRAPGLLGLDELELLAGQATRVIPEEIWHGLVDAVSRSEGDSAERHLELQLGPEHGSRWLHLGAAALQQSREGEPGIVLTLADITERKQYEAQLAHQAFHDPLTGLPNRALMMDRLEHAIRRHETSGKTMAVLFLDLDNFKVVNDSMGHKAGDALLVQIAERLSGSIRPTDTVARLGGDEFVILLEEIPDIEFALKLAETLVEEIQRPVDLEQGQVVVGGSIGLALGDEEVQEAGAILRNADIAMYRAKAAGRRRTIVFESKMLEMAEERLKLEGELRRAIEQGELTLYFQPIYDLHSGRCSEAEALVRWRHPERGLIPPIKFIPVAEESGLIVPLGEWVLGEACRWAVSWDRDHPELPPMSVSVNLSARQLQAPELVQRVAEVLAETGLPAHRLKLELTESMMMEDPDRASARLMELRGLGIRLAMDDFGTGYSSMAYLRLMPIDTLKIDRSFVSRLNVSVRDEAILKAIVEVAHSLNLTVTSEGIETQDQEDRLNMLGCEHGQGYLFSPPVPAADLARLLLDRRARVAA